ncbi:hypothetical protein CEXT_768611 [Caerostris extrusa]|uniref:Uncharacterized protein n=1 Tax=Caerostris extrusa TaxID=172846 RepID=A0AAV4RLR3_CAEEX|nr:hypothetical protein CEXT_768611 [Caerostris extrusa]
MRSDVCETVVVGIAHRKCKDFECVLCARVGSALLFVCGLDAQQKREVLFEEWKRCGDCFEPLQALVDRRNDSLSWGRCIGTCQMRGAEQRKRVMFRKPLFSWNILRLSEE